MVSVDILHSELSELLKQVTEILAQRRRLRLENTNEVADIDRSLSYALTTLWRELKKVWNELVGGLLHHPTIMRMIDESRGAEVAYLHRAAIRIEEFYQGKKQLAKGFVPLRRVVNSLEKQASKDSLQQMEECEKEIKNEVAATHAYFQSFRNDCVTLIKQEDPALLRIQGVGNDDSWFVFTNIIAWYVAFLAAVKRLERKGALKRKLLKAIAAAGLITALHSGPAGQVFENTIHARNNAKAELAGKGITSEQRTAYIPGINNLIYNGILPYGYHPEEKLKSLIPNILGGREGSITSVATGHEVGSHAREDAWRLYLGMPQQHNTFGISDYAPPKYKGTYCYKINGWFDMFFTKQPFRTPAEFIRDHSEKIANGERPVFGDVADIMGGHRIGIGNDEKGTFIYYYDVWDLAIPLEKEVYFPGTKILVKKSGFFGRPFIIYDRLYFDSETFEPLQALNIQRSVPSVDSGGVM